MSTVFRQKHIVRRVGPGWAWFGVFVARIVVGQLPKRHYVTGKLLPESFDVRGKENGWVQKLHPSTRIFQPLPLVLALIDVASALL